MAKAQIINFSDANFKAKLLSSSPSNTIAKDLSGNYFAIDANNDGEIQQTEADAVGELQVVESDSVICANTNIQGISSFTQIKKIKIDYAFPVVNPLTIANLQELQEIDFISSIWNWVPTYTVVNINNCNNLKKYKGSGFPIFTNTPLVEDVKLLANAEDSVAALFKNTLLSLETLTNLKILYFDVLNIQYNSIYAINLSHHNKIESFIIQEAHGSQLSIRVFNKVDLSHCSQLKNVSIHGYTNHAYNPTYYVCSVQELDISYCSNNTINGTGSNNLNLYSDFIAKLNVSNSPNLEKITLTHLERLQANNCPVLNEIRTNIIGLGATSVPLEALDCPNLKKMTLNYKYPSFDGSPFTSLENLSFIDASYPSQHYVPNEDLQIVLLNNNINLKTLALKDYTLKNLSLNGLPQLQSVSSQMTFNLNNPNVSQYLDMECMQTLNIQNCPLLTTLSLGGHYGLKNATIKNCQSLSTFEIPASYYDLNLLNSLEIENCTLLNKVKTPVNKLTNLKILNCPALEELDVERNLLTSFDLTGSMASIKNLNLVNNNLTAFNIQPFTNLETLYLSGNKITDLDMSMHPKISLFKYINSANYTTGMLNPPTYLKTVNLNGCPNIQTVDLESSVIR
ncbi:hypothetical protein EG350_08315 [Chryseobacterium shandongense]|nr:hypothetical protein EG350_08315 [Chryseobacterium shandongense]